MQWVPSKYHCLTGYKADVNSQAVQKRRDVFAGYQMPRQLLDNLATARVTTLRPLRQNDYGFVFANEQLMLAKGRLSALLLIVLISNKITILCAVITMYARGGGKRAQNAWVQEGTSIGAFSYICVQLFEKSLENGVFDPITASTAAFNTVLLGRLSSREFLCLLHRSPEVLDQTSGTLRIQPADIPIWNSLLDLRREGIFPDVMKALKKRNVADEEAE